MEGAREVIDLCGSPPPRADSPKRRKERGSPELGGPERGWDVHREKGERWRKRQRLGAPRVPLGRTVVELSDDDDDEDDDKKLARRLATWWLHCLSYCIAFCIRFESVS